MYLKRQRVPKNWPIPRKGTKYVAKSRFDLDRGIPLLIALRDILEVAQNRKEVKRAIHTKKLLVNGKPAKDEKRTLVIFDTISLVPGKKHYRLVLNGAGKFDLEEISEKESNQKIAKVSNKKILKGKKTQLNLEDGNNFLSEIKCNINDSVLINLKEKKVEKCLPLKKGAEVLVYAGKHSGKKGTVKKIDSKNKILQIESNGEKINVLIKQLMVTK